MARRQVSIFLNGKQAEAEIKKLVQAKKQVYEELKNMKRGSDEYNKKVKEIGTLNRLINVHKRELGGIKRSYNKLSSGLSEYLKIAAGAFAVENIIRAGVELFKTGAQMELLGKKAETVFGQVMPTVTAEANKHAAAMGLTTSQYVDASAAIGDLLIPMKFSREEAADMSTNLVNLSGALSEWTGGQRDATEVSNILAKAMLGEREELKGLGIAIQEEDVKNRLREKGLQDLTGEYLQQAKAVATLELIMEKSQDAQTAYLENGDTLVRQQAELAAVFTDVKERLATALIPVFSRLLDAAGALADGVTWLGEKLEFLTDPVKAAGNAFADQAQRVSQLDSELVPLLDRYDELSSQTSLTESEQAELAKIIQRVGEITPIAITEVDKYGKALSINAGASRDFIDAEKERLKFVNEESIATIEREIEAMEKKQEALQKIVDGPKQRTLDDGIGPAQTIGFDSDAIDEFNKKISDLTTRINGARVELSRLNGERLGNGEENAAPPTNNSDQLPPAQQAELERQKKLAEAAAKERAKAHDRELAEQVKQSERLAATLEGYREEARLSQLSDDDRKLEELRLQYQKQIDLATELETKGVAGATEQRLELERLRDAALNELQEQLAAENFAALEERYTAEFEEEQRIINENLAKKREAELEVKALTDEATKTDQEKAIEELQAYYDHLLELARNHGLDMAVVQELISRKQAEIRKKSCEEKQEDTENCNKKELELQAKKFKDLAQIAGAGYEVMQAIGAESSAFGEILALAEIGFNSARALSAAVAAGAGQPFPANVAAIATGVAAVVTNIAKARDILNNTPEVPQAFTGGMFNVRGETDGRMYNAQYIGYPDTGYLPPRPVLLASDRGQEYIISNPDLGKPMVMDHVRAIENIRRYGTSATAVPQFFSGGFTEASAPTSAAQPAGSTQSADANVMSQLIPLLARIDNTLTRLETNGVPAYISDITLLDAQKRTDELLEAGGGVG